MSLLRIVEGERDEARAENARLQERVEEAQEQLNEVAINLCKPLEEERDHYKRVAQDLVNIEQDRDRYKALAERRKKALRRRGRHIPTCDAFDNPEHHSPAVDKRCNCGLRAAIEEGKR